MNGHKITEVGRTTTGRCRQCNREAQQQRYAERRGVYGDRQRRYDEALAANEGQECCAICGALESNKIDTRRLNVDHDHETDKIRGLLCGLCNVGLGAFKDDVELLIKAINYLKERT